MGTVQLQLTRRAQRDLRALSPRDLRQIRRAFSETLAVDPLPENADARALSGRAPWRRLRVGELRVLYRALEPGEVEGVTAGRVIARIVHRGDLERAVATLR